MRVSSLWLIVFTLGAGVGCGGLQVADDVSESGIDRGGALMDLAAEVIDDAAPPDLTYLPPIDAAGFSCGDKTCAAGDRCCFTSDPDGGANLQTACMATCPVDRTMQFACDGPGNCGGNPCCLIIGQQIHDATCSAHAADCAPLADIQNSKITTRLCHVPEDCTAGGVTTDLTSCCTMMQLGQTYHLCLSQKVASKLGGMITCP